MRRTMLPCNRPGWFAAVLTLLWFGPLAVVQANDNNNDDGSNEHALKHRQVEWLRSKGGFFNRKIGFAPPGGKASPAGGLYALEDIRKDDLLIYLPKHVLLGPPPGAGEDKCATAKRLADEYELGEDGDFWPYVQYVYESFPHKSVPMAWSERGKHLIRNIVGQELLDPASFGESYSCYGTGTVLTAKQKEMIDAGYRIVSSRAWDEVLVPVYDMGNHRNGRYHNMDQVHDSSTHDEFHVVALRDVKAGEQLCLSYNECNDSTCYAFKYTLVTPQLLLFFGFVEQYPQRWNFVTGGFVDEVEEEEELLFDLLQDEGTGALRVHWIYQRPTLSQVEWLEIQVERLRGMRRHVQNEMKHLKKGHEHEGATAWEFYQANIVAMEQAILWANGTPPVTTRKLSENATTAASKTTATAATNDCSSQSDKTCAPAAVEDVVS